MKAAISVDDTLMKDADAAARELGMSRDELIAEALRGYLREREQARITSQLNLAYPTPPTPDEIELIRNLRRKLPVPDQW